MIVSHRHRFIFTAIPKTGTHSVRQALRPHLCENDLEQVGLFVNKRFPFPELAAITHGHISLQQVRPFVGESAFRDYFKFAFVRNPFDRFVSYCAFMTRDSDAFQRDPRRVMRKILFQVRPLKHVLFQPQHSFVGNDDGDLVVDQIGRVEEMQVSFDAICEKIGIPKISLGRMNGSRHGSYRTYYDDELAEGVASLYRRDLDLFKYEF